MHDRSDNRTIVLAREPSFRLGAVEVRPGTRELVGPGGRATLEPRVMMVLVALARAQGEILTRDDLTTSCWEGRVVGEDALSRVVSRLRRASEGVGRDGWTLETITKVGYRLLPAGHDPEAGPVRSTPPDARVPDRRLLLGAGGAVLAVAAAGGGLLWLRRPRISDKARDLYRRGRDAMGAGLPESDLQAQGLLREAVAEAPDYAEAWGALALAYQASLKNTAPARQAGVTAQAQAAAQRAVELDPNEAQGVAALALLAPVYRNWRQAEGVYNRALALHAREAQLQFIYARLLLSVGRIKEAVVRAQAAVALDEFAAWHHFTLGSALWAANRVEEADTLTAKALQRWPRHYALWFLQMSLLTFTGRPDRAVAMGADLANRPLNIAPPDVELSLLTARALQTRAPADIKAAVDAHGAAARRGSGYAENAMNLFSALGRLDEGFAIARANYLNEGFAMGEQRFASGVYSVGRLRHTYSLFMPPMRAMRADPRFRVLMRDIGLADYWRTSGHRPDDPTWDPGA